MHYNSKKMKINKKKKKYRPTDPIIFSYVTGNIFFYLASAVSEEKSKMPQPIRGHGSHLVSPNGPKNTKLVEDVEILLPLKFR